MTRRRRVLAVTLAAWVVLLLASSVVRSLRDAPAVHGATVETPAFDDDGPVDGRVRIAYELTGPPDAPPLVLLHGSPGSRHDFDGLVPLLAGRYRCLVLDLPGFGESTRDVPSYSIRAHARYVDAALGRLGIDSAHVLGYSMGGGVAIELADVAPRRVRSLTLVSGIGVQEMELFGDYALNHAVHGVQLGLLWLAREATPHFGALDGTFFGVPYARNFYDSDQRPLRGILSRIEVPVAIVHGRGDFLVPPEAAVEHARIVPQARLTMLPDADHFTVFVHPGLLAPSILSFLDDVEAGVAPTRAEATPERLAAAARPFDPGSLPPFGGMALAVLMLAIVAGTLASEDLTCIVVGLLIGQGRLEVLPGVLACVVGIFLGDVGLYVAGRVVGRPALRRAPLRWFVSEQRVALASEWFRHRGPVAILLSRFMPGARLPTYVAAGVLRTPVLRFLAYFMLAVVLWTPLLVGGAALLGDRVFGYWHWFERHALLGLGLAALWGLVLVKGIVPLFSFRGRRAWVGRLRRIVRWEFWPPWAFYPPVVAWVLWLGVRHRGLLTFTAANPAMPAGGFVGESKHRILEGLGHAAPFVAPSRLVPAGEDLERRAARVTGFMRERGLGYPVVLKPDCGQRGSGVAIARGDDDVRRYLAGASYDVLAQAYAPGRELGVFYARRPDEATGRIISITDKRMPEVVGDGRHTLEELVLQDPRAVCMARHYLALHGAAAQDVVPAGRRVRLVELGTHCRGAVFLDGHALWSEPLARRIDAISRGYEGFFFGRYDIRTDDLDALRRGESFTVIELNGVTSEATHVYDPGIGLVQAWRTLCRQWSLAFEIGAGNRRRGIRPASLREIVSLARGYRRGARGHGAVERELPATPPDDA